jgi:predicted kinase
MDKQPLPVLIVLVGLPRSGKSSLAKSMGYPIVCLDSIRLALTGREYCEEAEAIVETIAKLMIYSLFLSGHDYVLMDATNVSIEDRNRWISKRWRREFVHIDTPCSECIARAIECDKLNLIPIIDIKGAKFVMPSLEELDDHERDQTDKDDK